MMKKDVPREEVVGYVARLLKVDANMPYAAIVKQAKKDGYHVYPLIAGLAKKSAGLPPGPRRLSAGGGASRKRGPGRPRKSTSPAPAAAGMAPRKRGRPPKRASTSDIVSMLQGLTGEIESMRNALNSIADIAARF